MTRLKQLADSRELTQERLHDLSGIAQPVISDIFRRIKTPSREQLEALSRALGLRLSDFLHDIPTSKDKLWGYLATPLTAVVGDPASERELHRVVELIEATAKQVDSTFAIYWPGRYTHPKRNSEVKPETVYRMDRAQASALDFIILFLADPSYGVGQENEIASQAGLPAIRMASEGLSRMMSGSFLRATTVPFSGDLKKGIQFDEKALGKALEGVRLECFHQDALYDGLRKATFGDRLRQLVNKRCRDYEEFARSVGISLSYVHAMFEEPLRVSNPGTRLLQKMATLLRVTVSDLVGDSADGDPKLEVGKAEWWNWVRNTPGLDGQLATRLRDDWLEAYELSKGTTSARARITTEMSALDWQRLYDRQKSSLGNAEGHDDGNTLFRW